MKKCAKLLIKAQFLETTQGLNRVGVTSNVNETINLLSTI
jgi:hypothetical protein